MLGTYACAIAICVVAVILGRGACLLAGVPGSSWLSAPVGLGFLLAACQVFVRAPGHGYTASALLLVLCVASLLLARRRGQPWPPLADGLAVGFVVLVFLTIPFLSNDRVGVLGVSMLNDTHWHLFLAQQLLDPSFGRLDSYGATGYPVGPHAVAAVFSQGLGTSVDRGLTGLLMATPMLGGLAALGAMADLARWQRLVPAMLTGIPYMIAAWYGQSAFKEPIMSVLLLGVLVALQQGRAERFRRPAAVVVPIAVLLAGVVYEYSYPGLIWPGAVLICWAVLELSLGGAWRRVVAIARGVGSHVWGLLAAVVVLVVLVAPDISRIHAFWVSNAGSAVGTAGGVVASSLANLAGPLHAIEGLNMWAWGDFRVIGPHVALTHIFAVFAGILLVIAILDALRRRDLAWLAALAGVALVYLYTTRAQSPYVVAKALVVPAPIIVLGSGSTLMRAVGAAPWSVWRRIRLRPRPALVSLVAALAAVAFFVISFGSSTLALDDALVGPSAHTAELRSLRPLLHGKPTLAMFNDDYFKWELLGVPVSAAGYASPINVGFSPDKPWVYGQPLDFNNFTPQTLDEFAYVVAVRSAALSQPPPNFHLVGQSRNYAVYKRVGPTPDFRVLSESGQPGAVLDCRERADRRLSRHRGIAAVRPAPIAVSVPALVPGQTAAVTFRLPRGRWQLSLPYTSDQTVTVSKLHFSATLVPNLDRPGNPWPVGTIRSAGLPIVLSFHMHPAPLGTTSPISHFFSPQTLVAVRPGRDRIVPLRRACGRYVDWYRLRTRSSSR